MYRKLNRFFIVLGMVLYIFSVFFGEVFVWVFVVEGEIL